MGTKVIDIGGKKEKKRGLFDINKYSDDVTYVNIDRSTEPDIVADATAIPLPEGSFDVVVLGEILEHVPDPIAVLKEARRLVKTGGTILVTVPFMYPVHADPHDFGRYTDYFWQETSKTIGFSNIKIERQGGMFAIIALAVQHLFRAKNKSWRPIQMPIVNFLMWLDRRTTAPLLLDWTTGYGITYIK